MTGSPLALTLGIAPTTRGFGWVAMKDPLSVYDHGAAYARSEKNLRCVEYFERLVDRLQPELIIMEGPSPRVFRSKRVLELHRLLTSSALLRRIEVRTYRRPQVHSVFATMGAQSLQDIAEVVVGRLPDLELRLPRRRSTWSCEDRRMGRFFAAALVLTHFHLDGLDAIEGMKPAA